MRSKKPGKNSSRNVPEILDLSPHGMWLLVRKKEYFLDYERYPWFQDAKIRELRAVELSGLGSGLYWPELDIDVELDALENPERYPLIARIDRPATGASAHPRMARKTRPRKVA